ncbi:MAG: FAD-binding oxidoreductase [Albidovulum sp.]|nr:FAD-binding oxidoreductase [Albidovulum sp.]
MSTWLARNFVKDMNEYYDVVIIGGAAMGSSAAFFLMENSDFDGSVLIVERDPTFERSSTALSLSSVRHQFTNPLNVRISQFGTEFIREFRERTSIEGHGIDLSFQENGYLFLWSEEYVENAKAQVAVQNSLGADIVLLSPQNTKEFFPHLRVDDIAAASFGRSGEGWFDNVGLMDGMRRKACSLGAEFVADEVVGLELLCGRVANVYAASGRSIGCGAVINASGPRCAHIAGMLGIALPVVPQKRSVFVIDCQRSPVGRLPLMIDTTGVFCRPEGSYFICGSEPLVAGDTDVDDFEVVHEEFEEIIWPALAARSENFESVKVVNFWAGHYAFNLFDQNAIVGAHPEIKNFFFVNGFSGHGIQQSPAMGRAISELVAYGEYRSLDLSAMGFDRVLSGIRFSEGAII